MLIVSKRLRRYSIRANNAITLPEFFSNRFRENKKVIMLLNGNMDDYDQIPLHVGKLSVNGIKLINKKGEEESKKLTAEINKFAVNQFKVKKIVEPNYGY